MVYVFQPMRSTFFALQESVYLLAIKDASNVICEASRITRELQDI